MGVPVVDGRNVVVGREVVGVRVGLTVDGECDGRYVAPVKLGVVVGARTGARVGARVGEAEGERVGARVGAVVVVGLCVGEGVGFDDVGAIEGCQVSPGRVGETVGLSVGGGVGACVGLGDGAAVGELVRGDRVGRTVVTGDAVVGDCDVGCADVGMLVGLRVGDAEGRCEEGDCDGERLGWRDGDDVGDAVATREVITRFRVEPGLLNPRRSSESAALNESGHTYESLFSAWLGPPSCDEL